MRDDAHDPDKSLDDNNDESPIGVDDNGITYGIRLSTYWLVDGFDVNDTRDESDDDCHDDGGHDDNEWFPRCNCDDGGNDDGWHDDNNWCGMTPL
jgi:hypothetical protein